MCKINPLMLTLRSRTLASRECQKEDISPNYVGKDFKKWFSYSFEQLVFKKMVSISILSNSDHADRFYGQNRQRNSLVSPKFCFCCSKMFRHDKQNEV